ncbi:GntR family transcriptional regulator [Rhodococcus sp. AD45-ID]|uniref:GntR family transcriptional regulator n=1 Tax=unclassified Rhodococcus (in: high G+C Gram-positive bacteria) TaxID=192944 RepID=UPI0005D396CA|nr:MULTISPECIES: GntR family transcriptional regulator [unclassified Rhodococcus (in: high G+C Gram-positive bacteria)]KJF24334.1 HTH-type transcriptional repressor yvoA [Rhodococcus sp. AD45]MDV8065069.1 GntR family transcriptional regulator [Rhodococcus sp. IEGM 1366]PSR42644.1 GntR family transcriptional regulator [Rhodococcus sp. AD45-ID]
MIDFRIDRRSGIPTYVQLVVQVKQALRLGDLQVGDRLPTAKDVVGALAINPNTVLKAYKELERDGLVAPRPGLGTFVTKSLAKPGMAENSALRAELSRWMRDAVAAGLERTDIEALVDMELEREFVKSDSSEIEGETS